MTSTVEHEVTLRWIADADPSTLGGAAEIVSRALRNLFADPLAADTGESTRAVDSVLRACALTDPDVVPLTEARKLVYPVLLLLRKTDEWSRHKEHLRGLGRRTDLVTKHPVKDLFNLSRYGVGVESAVVVAPVASPETGRPADCSAARVLEDPSDSDGAVRAWLLHRQEASVGERARGDISLLRQLHTSYIPATLAEAVHADDEVRNSDAFRDYVDALTSPFQVSTHGAASSALLNAVVRRVRPRLFLRDPRALVAEENAAKLDGGAVRRDIGRDIAEPVVRCMGVLWEETDRLTPRKPRLRSARMAAEQALQRLGLRLEGREGETLSFDPIFHMTSDAAEYGDAVRVARPGVIDDSNGELVLKVHVARQHEGENSRD